MKKVLLEKKQLSGENTDIGSRCQVHRSRQINPISRLNPNHYILGISGSGSDSRSRDNRDVNQPTVE